MKRFEDMTPGEKARYCEKRYAELKNKAELRIAEARSSKDFEGSVRSKLRLSGKSVKRSDEQLAEEIGESRTRHRGICGLRN